MGRRTVALVAVACLSTVLLVLLWASPPGAAAALGGLLPRRRPPPQTSQTLSAVVELSSSSQRSAAVQVSCALDVSQALVRLMGGITNAQASKSACSNLSSEDGKAKCSNSINGAIYNFVLLAAMISQSVVHCAETIEAPAVCASAVTGFLGNMGIVASAGSGCVYKCNLWWEHRPVPPYGVTTTRAHPTPHHWTTPSPALKLPASLPALVPQEYWAGNSDKGSYQADMTNCFVNVVLGATNLGRAAITIMDQVKKCPVDTPLAAAGKEACATDVVSVFGALGLAARYLSMGVVDCAGFFETGDSELSGAECSGAIAGVAGGAISATAQAMALQKACDEAVAKQR